MANATDLMHEEPIFLLALKLFEEYKKLAEAYGFEYYAHGFRVKLKEYHEDYISQDVLFGGRLELRTIYVGDEDSTGDDFKIDDFNDDDFNDCDCDGDGDLETVE